VAERIQLAIVGSGPAGLTAAIYSARAQLHPVVLEGEPSSTSDQPGGQLMLTTEVENYPGFIDAVLGPDLMGRMRAQALRFGADLRVAKVARLELAASPFSLWLGDHDEPDVVADAVILASGARALELAVPGEARLLGHGLSTCATCDGFFFRGQEIAVIGGGDSAIEEALFLTRFATKVTILHRRDELRASRIMQQRAFDHDKIEFRWNTVVTEVLGDDAVTGLATRDTMTGEAGVLAATGVFVAIGHEPNTQLVKGQLELDEGGYVVTTEGTETSVDGVFAAGDVQDRIYRQAVTSAGSGCMAALDAEHWLAARAH
jgi:thioredoxin reductase (NADPH)